MATQKELREAYKRGLHQGAGANSWHYSEASLEEYARIAYPPKMVERPRVVQLGDYQVRLEPAGFLSRRYHKSTFVGLAWESHLSANEVRALADLFDHPTEMVEEDV